MLTWCLKIRRAVYRRSLWHRPNCEAAPSDRHFACFPILECGLHRQKICMFAISRVLLDGSACPRKPAAACQTNSVFRKDLCQSVRELTIKCRYVRLGTHNLPPTWNTSAYLFTSGHGRVRDGKVARLRHASVRRLGRARATSARITRNGLTIRFPLVANPAANLPEVTAATGCASST